MKRVTLILFVLLSTTCFAQNADTTKTIDDISNWLEGTYNIIHMNEGFYDCAKELLSENNDIGNILLFNICADKQSMEEASYSDGGMKAVNIFASIWVKTCADDDNKQDKKYLEYCYCLLKGYSKKPMGMEEILSEDFQESIPNKGVKSICREKAGVNDL